MSMVKLELASAPTCAAGVRCGFFKTIYRMEFSPFCYSTPVLVDYAHNSGSAATVVGNGPQLGKGAEDLNGRE